MKQFQRMNRLPPYTFAVVVEQMMEERRRGEDVIDLGMGNPDVPTPAPIVEKMKEALDNPGNHRYSASRGIKGLRKAVCDWYQRKYEVELDPETEAIPWFSLLLGLAGGVCFVQVLSLRSYTHVSSLLLLPLSFPPKRTTLSVP